MLNNKEIIDNFIRTRPFYWNQLSPREKFQHVVYEQEKRRQDEKKTKE